MVTSWVKLMHQALVHFFSHLPLPITPLIIALTDDPSQGPGDKARYAKVDHYTLHGSTASP